MTRNYTPIIDRESRLYFTTSEAACILMPLDKEPTASKRLMRSMGARGYPPPIGPESALYAPARMRFLPEVIYATAIELGSLDAEWFAKPEAWEQEVRLRFTALGKPLEGRLPTLEEWEAATEVFRSRPNPYQPKSKSQSRNGLRRCAECKGWFPPEDFRRNTRGGLVSYCRPCDNLRKRLSHRKRHGNYEGEIITQRRDLHAEE